MINVCQDNLLDNLELVHFKDFLLTSLYLHLKIRNQTGGSNKSENRTNDIKNKCTCNLNMYSMIFI
jgi:hypothetical protein